MNKGELHMDDETYAWCLFQEADGDESGSLDRDEIATLARSIYFLFFPRTSKIPFIASPACIEVLNVKVHVFVLLLFATLPDCSQNQTAVSDTLRLLSDF